MSSYSSTEGSRIEYEKNKNCKSEDELLPTNSKVYPPGDNIMPVLEDLCRTFYLFHITKPRKCSFSDPVDQCFRLFQVIMGYLIVTGPYCLVWSSSIFFTRSLLPLGSSFRFLIRIRRHQHSAHASVSERNMLCRPIVCFVLVDQLLVFHILLHMPNWPKHYNSTPILCFTFFVYCQYSDTTPH